MEAKRTPLIELLERVPRNAVLVVEHGQFSSSSYPVGRLCHEAADALRAALAEQQEPVAWMVYTLDGKSVCVADNPADFTDEHRALPLYTKPFPTDEALLREALYALEYASDMTKPEDLQGCGCPICTSIAALSHRLEGKT